MRLRQVLDRLLGLWRQGGLWAVMRQLGRRFLYRRWVSRVYDAGIAVEPAQWPAACRYQWVPRLAALEPGLRTQLLGTRAGALLRELDADDGLYLVWHGMALASWGAVMRHSRQTAVLGLPPGSRLIGLCETDPAHRGKGLYVQALRATVAALQAGGEGRLFIEVLEDNLASIRGIERAGFRNLGRVDARILAGAWVWRAGRLHRLKGIDG